jgi:hypothetical protein
MPKRVLIVDDDPLIRRSLAEIVREIGASVDVAEDGEHALAAFAANQPEDVFAGSYKRAGSDGDQERFYDSTILRFYDWTIGRLDDWTMVDWQNWGSDYLFGAVGGAMPQCCISGTTSTSEETSSLVAASAAPSR